MENVNEKKALFIATVGGFVTQFEMNNVRILQQLGYEVHSAANFQEPVYCVKERELKEQGVILHQADIAKSPFLWRQNLHALKQICEIVKAKQITLIHCHTPVGGLLGRLAGILCASKKLKVVYTAHGFHFYKGAPWRNWIFYYTVERFLARFTDVLITINEEDCVRAQRFKLRKGGKVYKIPGEGLNMEAFHPVCAERRQELRKKLGLTEDTFFILSVGELSGNKNHREIISLMPSIIERLKDKRVFYGICGDGFYREDLEKQIRELGLSGNVMIYGYRENVADMLSCADCFVFPSVREGLGMAALEALAIEIPVITSDNRGTREYMRDGINGLVCNVKKPGSFADAVERVCRMTEPERRWMCAAGRETACRFELKNTNKIMLEIYRAVDMVLASASKINADTAKASPVEQRLGLSYLSAQEAGMKKAQ